jgi:S-formylglutathione hydrolase FrmB
MSVQNQFKGALIFFFLILFVCPAFGQEVAKQKVVGKLFEVKVTSPSLKGNLLGDPVEQTIAVYLPPSYETSPKKRYPVVYLLHGYGGSSRTWTTDEPYSFNVPPLMDALIAVGQTREMIVVAPSANNSYHGSFYANSTVTGNWEDYIFRDVVAYIDANYRTLARASSRGIAGHSMGGYGAVAIGMKHADVFSAIYAHAPCCLGLSDTEEELKNPSPLWKLIGSYTSREHLTANFDSDENLYANLFVAMSAAFSPNAVRKPFYADFPFDVRDEKLQLNEAVNTKWKSKTPIYLIDDYKQNLLSLRGFVFEFGAKEVFESIRTTTPRFSKALAERGIPHRFEVYEGGTHESKVKERLEKHVFPFFSEKLDFSNP